MNTIRAGQIRTLNPLTDIPATERGTGALVLITSDPRDYYMPDDISYRPGECRIIYAMPILTDVDNACLGDIILPTDLTGLPHPVYVVTDALSTVWLPLDDDGDRFGPVEGTVNPDHLIGHPNVTKGTLTPSREDALWRARGDMVTNLNRLNGWW